MVYSLSNFVSKDHDIDHISSYHDDVTYRLERYLSVRRQQGSSIMFSFVIRIQ